MSGHKYGVCVGQAIDMADQKFEAQIPEKSPDSVNPIPNQNHPQKTPIQHQIQGNLNESVPFFSHYINTKSNKIKKNTMKQRLDFDG